MTRRFSPKLATAIWWRAIGWENYFILGVSALTVVGWVTISRFKGTVFFTVDSAAYVGQANEMLRHYAGFFSFSANYLESLGNIPWPTNFAYLPEFYGAFDGNQVDPVKFYLIASLIIFSCNYALVIAIGLTRRAACLAGLVVLALTMPYTIKWIYTGLFWWDGPHWIPFLYATPAAIVAFFCIGRHASWISAVLATVTFLTLCIWAIGTLPKAVFIWLSAVATYAAAFTLFANTARELVLKVLAGAILIAICLMGPFDFLRGLYGYSTNAAFVPWVSVQTVNDLVAVIKGSLVQAHVSHEWPTFSGYIGEQFANVRFVLRTPLLIGGILGALAAILNWRTARSAAALGAGTLFLILVSFQFFYSTVLLGAIYAPIVLLTVIALVESCRFLHRRAHLPAVPSQYRSGLTVGVIAVGAALIVFRGRAAPIYGGIPYPPRTSPLVDYLTDHLRFSVDDQFRGRFLNLARRAHNPDKDNDSLVYQVLASEISFAELLGNDLNFSGLGYFEIPTPQENNRFASPRNIAFFGRFLTTPAALQQAQYRVISRPDPKFLSLIGVNSLLTDAPLEDDRFVLVDAPLAANDLKLYRVAESNIGQYSPTKPWRVTNFAEALQRMAEPDFEPRNDVVVEEEILEGLSLVPSQTAEVIRTQEGIRVRASSEGRSMLVLPFEFSRCLLVQDRAAPSLKLFRANFLLTGILFEKELDATIVFQFGPFTNSDCRLKDIDDLQRIGFDYQTFARYRRENPDFFVFRVD